MELLVKFIPLFAAAGIFAVLYLIMRRIGDATLRLDSTDKGFPKTLKGVQDRLYHVEQQLQTLDLAIDSQKRRLNSLSGRIGSEVREQQKLDTAEDPEIDYEMKPVKRKLRGRLNVT